MSNFKVYKSSAGSGKTFTLVKEYLKLCLEQNDPLYFRRILSITFTNKATYEMKERIIETLKAAKNYPENKNDLLAQCQAETQLQDLIFKQKCEQILSNILHHYSDFSISTIDRFTHKLLRTFSKDLSLPNTFQVELDPTPTFEKIVARLIEKIGEHEALDKFLFHFVFNKIDEDSNWKIETDLYELAKNLNREDYAENLSKVESLSLVDYRELIEEYKTKNKKFEREIKEKGEILSQLIESTGLNKDLFANGARGITKYIEYLLHFRSNNLKPNSTVIKSIETEKFYASKAKSDEKSIIEQISPELKRLLVDVVQLVEQEHPHFLSRKLILERIHALALSTWLKNELNHYLKEEQIVQIEEFNQKISEVVLSEPMPFIYERLGEKYHHIMIDEFQDTSILQFLNLLPLVEESLAKSKMSLIVGDAKQAIYRFRGGEVNQFSEMPHYNYDHQNNRELIEQRLEAIRSNYQEEKLAVNYRSENRIIDFNNEFFSFLMEQFSFSDRTKKVFEDVKQGSRHEIDKGYVELYIPDSEAKKEQEDLIEDYVLQTILDCEKRNVPLEDIAVLCATKKEIARIGSFLSSKGIDVISAEALLINTSYKVQFIIHLMYYLLDQNDVGAKTGILDYLHHNIEGTSDLEKIHQDLFVNHQSIEELYPHYFNASFFNDIEGFSLYEKVSALIRQFDLGKESDIYLQFFQERIFEFSIKESNSMQSFLAYWEDHKAKLSIDAAETSGAVQLMTIHKSKGLEFQVCILPYFNRKVRNNGGDLWVEELPLNSSNLKSVLVPYKKELKDSSLASIFLSEEEKYELDLLNESYVALSRASNEMYIQTDPLPKQSGSRGLVQWMNAFKTQMNEVDSSLYQLGEKKFFKKSDKYIENEAFELKPISSDWRNRIQISLESAAKWEEEDGDLDSRKYGVLIHELLSKITDENYRDAIEQFYMKGSINESEKRQLNGSLSELLKKKELQFIFDPKNSNKVEQSLVTAEGQIIRPDRLIYTNEEVIIIDFKTGKARSSDEKQLTFYKSVIKETTNQPVKAYLLYLESLNLKEVV